MMEVNKPTAVIAGGGLAGLACAKRLVDAGFQVTLLEAEAQWGGRTASWHDPADGQPVESGKHTFFGPYTHLTRLLNEVGVDLDDIVSWNDKIGFLQQGASPNIFGIDPLRNPLQLIVSLLGNNNLIGPLEKLNLGLAFANGLLVLEHYEQHTMAALAKDGYVDKQTYERIIRPLSRGLAFCDPEELSAYVILSLLLDLAVRPLNLRAGSFKGGMTEVMINPITRWLAERGAILRLTSPVKSIRVETEEPLQTPVITGFELENGEVVQGDVYISALSLEVFQKLLPPELAQLPYFQKIASLETASALSVQLWYDQTFINRDEFIFFTNSPIVVIQDDSRLTFPYPGTRISLQIFDKNDDKHSDQDLIDRSVAEINRFIPASRSAQLQKAVVVRHRAIAIKPGVHNIRPTQISPVTNFFLAGDYTRQNWFTTMEGATRSGEMAAAGVKKRYSSQTSYVKVGRASLI